MTLSTMCPKLALVALAAACSGCAKNSPPLVPAAGKVRSDGKGVPNAVVQFIPDPSKNPNGYAAQATTGADGSFALKTPSHGDGASPGWYRVTVVGYGGKPKIPMKYTRVDKTTLLVEIPQGGTSEVVLKVD